MKPLTTEQAKLVHAYPSHVPMGLPLPSRASDNDERPSDDDPPDDRYSL